MPPRVQLVPLVVTFDALETLIQVTGGAGYQYWCAARCFLNAARGASDVPNAPESVASQPPPQSALDAFNKHVLVIIREGMLRARTEWAKQHPGENPKTMPIGGEDDHELTTFWSHVLRRVFTELALPGLSEEDQVRLRALASGASDASSPRNDPWHRFVETVVWERFGSTQAHSWLDAGEDTLVALRAWNAGQWKRVQAMQARGVRVESNWPPTRLSERDQGVTPLLVLARPPAIVSNMDPRLQSVMQQLGAVAEAPILPLASLTSSWQQYARDPEQVAAWPLVSDVITGRDAGRAKPSARGLCLAAERAGLKSADAPPDLIPHLHIHVGDAEADRKACETRRCRYLCCDGAIGVEWNALMSELAAAESAVASVLNSSASSST